MAMDFTLRWDGEHATQAVLDAAATGLTNGAEYIKSTAVPLTPKRTGALRNSAGTSVDATAGEASIYFDTPYAVAQHENLAYHHPDGQAKYLETALDIAGSDAIDLVKAAVRRAFR